MMNCSGRLGIARRAFDRAFVLPLLIMLALPMGTLLMDSMAVPPDVLISYPVDGATFRANEWIDLNASSTWDPDGKDVTIHWRSNLDGDLGYGAVQKVHLSPGVHIITCEAEDGDGEESSSTRQITILPLERPIATLEANKTMVEIFEPILFSGSKSVDPDFSIAAYRFDFGDGTIIPWNSSSERSHAYSIPGEYKVRLDVRDIHGLEDSTNVTVTVRNRSPPKDTRGEGRDWGIALIALLVIIVIALAVAYRRSLKNRKKEEEAALRRRQMSKGKGVARNARGRASTGAHKVMQPKGPTRARPRSRG